jgi:hypothetical protein
VQICSLCNAQSPDTAKNCTNCNADLSEYSVKNAALERFKKNYRVRHVLLEVHGDACPACRARQGAYPKDSAPKLPLEGCSHANGCRCFYQPVLDEIYP